MNIQSLSQLILNCLCYVLLLCCCGIVRGYWEGACPRKHVQPVHIQCVKYQSLYLSDYRVLLLDKFVFRLWYYIVFFRFNCSMFLREG